MSRSANPTVRAWERTHNKRVSKGLGNARARASFAHRPPGCRTRPAKLSLPLLAAVLALSAAPPSLPAAPPATHGARGPLSAPAESVFGSFNSPAGGAARSWQGAYSVTPFSTFNLYNGNTLTAVPLVSYAPVGPAVSFALYHNSADATDNKSGSAGQGFDLGRGWSTSYSGRVTLNQAGTVATVIEDDGTRNKFTKNGSVWDPPTGDFDVLTQLADGGWELLRPSQSKRVFDANGLLIEVYDSTGNKVTVERDPANGNRIVAIAYQTPDLEQPAAGLALDYGSDRRLSSVYRVSDGMRWVLDYELAGSVVGAVSQFSSDGTQPTYEVDYAGETRRYVCGVRGVSCRPRTLITPKGNPLTCLDLFGESRLESAWGSKDAEQLAARQEFVAGGRTDPNGADPNAVDPNSTTRGGPPPRQPQQQPEASPGTPCGSGQELCGKDQRKYEHRIIKGPDGWFHWSWGPFSYRGFVIADKQWVKVGGLGCVPGMAPGFHKGYKTTQAMRFEVKGDVGLVDGLTWSFGVTESTEVTSSVNFPFACCDGYWFDGSHIQNCHLSVYEGVWRTQLIWQWRLPGNGFDDLRVEIGRVKENDFIPIKCCDHCDCLE